jgi:ribosome-associated toxin RatA of RatAB toxin-antitoxin module
MINRKLRVPHSASEMFQLVDNIDDYKNFLPWCKDSKVLSRTEDEVRATLVLSASGLQKSFTTCNRLQKDKMIEIGLIDGPFRRLEGYWLFHAESERQSTIQFDLEFEFSSRILSMAFAPVFHQVANTLVDAFAKRAIQLYGQHGQTNSAT